MTNTEPEADFKALTLSYGFIPMLLLKSSKISNLEMVSEIGGSLIIDLNSAAGSREFGRSRIPHYAS